MAIHGFTLIGVPIQYEVSLPYRISTNLSIDRPSENQLRRIKKYLSGFSDIEDFSTPFENIIVPKRLKDIGGLEVYFMDTLPLNKEDWRYSIVKFKSEQHLSFEHPSHELFNLDIASLISDKGLYLITSFLSRAQFGSKTEGYDHLQQIDNKSQEIILTKADLATLKVLNSQVNKVEAEYPDIYHSLKLYKSLPRLVGYNELLCLGLFSVIESVLTHNPISNVDSIGHQIRTKVKLLTNRFDRQPDYSKFGNIQSENLWKKLYDFRSKIAHGGKIDFNGSLQILTDAYEVQLFLEHFLKILLRGALNEPQLYTDLKAC